MSREIAGLMLAGLLFMVGVPSIEPQSQTLVVAHQETAPDLNAIVASLEEVQKTNAATMKPYQVTREYKVFHENDVEPTSTILVLINFVPPTSETYVIQKRSGNERGEKIVRKILDQEVESAKDVNHGQVTSSDYKFFFIRRDTFETAAEYVLRIAPTRKQKTLLRGEVWVDANTFRIRRVEGIPSKSPSFFIKDIHLTIQYAEVHGSWLPVSFDAHARVLLAGLYSISAHNLNEKQIVP